MSSESSTAPVSRRAARAARERRGWGVFLRDVAIIVVVALVVSFLVKTFVVRSFYIPSGSMEQTLQINDRILVDELTPNFNGYHRGDIIVFRDPGGWLPPQPPQPSRGPFIDGVEWLLSLVGLAAPDSSDHLIKRVIGLPGDHVTCCNAFGQVEVNGVPIDESAYVNLAPGEKAPMPSPTYDVIVPEGSVWVLGDNRDHSADSRYNMDKPGKGFVPMADIVGRAFLRTWPFDRFGSLGTDGDAFDGVPSPSPSSSSGP